MHPRLVTLAALIALPVSMVSAQSSSPKNVISIQPLSAVFQVYAGEFERSATKSVTWGLGGTYLGEGFFDDFSYTSAEFKLRFYPAGVALHGFSIGAAAGYASVTGDNNSGGTTSAGAPTVGVLLEYQWLMGSRKNFTVALGVGAKALYIDQGEFTSSFTARYPTARISFGFAF